MARARPDCEVQLEREDLWTAGTDAVSYVGPTIASLGPPEATPTRADAPIDPPDILRMVRLLTDDRLSAMTVLSESENIYFMRYIVIILAPVVNHP